MRISSTDDDGPVVDVDLRKVDASNIRDRSPLSKLLNKLRASASPTASPMASPVLQHVPMPSGQYLVSRGLPSAMVVPKEQGADHAAPEGETLATQVRADVRHSNADNNAHVDANKEEVSALPDSSSVDADVQVLATVPPPVLETNDGLLSSLRRSASQRTRKSPLIAQIGGLDFNAENYRERALFLKETGGTKAVAFAEDDLLPLSEVRQQMNVSKIRDEFAAGQPDPMSEKIVPGVSPKLSSTSSSTSSSNAALRQQKEQTSQARPEVTIAVQEQSSKSNFIFTALGQLRTALLRQPEDSAVGSLEVSPEYIEQKALRHSVVSETAEEQIHADESKTNSQVNPSDNAGTVPSEIPSISKTRALFETLAVQPLQNDLPPQETTSKAPRRSSSISNRLAAYQASVAAASTGPQSSSKAARSDDSKSSGFDANRTTFTGDVANGKLELPSASLLPNSSTGQAFLGSRSRKASQTEPLTKARIETVIDEIVDKDRDEGKNRDQRPNAGHLRPTSDKQAPVSSTASIPAPRETHERRVSFGKGQVSGTSLVASNSADGDAGRRLSVSKAREIFAGGSSSSNSASTFKTATTTLTDRRVSLHEAKMRFDGNLDSSTTQTFNKTVPTEISDARVNVNEAKQVLVAGASITGNHNLTKTIPVEINERRLSVSAAREQLTVGAGASTAVSSSQFQIRERSGSLSAVRQALDAAKNRLSTSTKITPADVNRHVTPEAATRDASRDTVEDKISSGTSSTGDYVTVSARQQSEMVRALPENVSSEASTAESFTESGQEPTSALATTPQMNVIVP